MPKESLSPRTFRGLLDPQTGGVAIAALLLGVVGMINDIWGWTQGPRPSLLAPEQVVIIPHTYSSGVSYVRFAMRMSYINEGPPKENSIVSSESLTMRIGARVIEHSWHSFESFVSKGCSLESERSEDIYPVVVGGANSASHVTFFAPRAESEEKHRYRNFLRLSDFLEETHELSDAALTLSSELVDGGTLGHECSFWLEEFQIERLRSNCAVTVPCRSE